MHLPHCITQSVLIQGSLNKAPDLGRCSCLSFCRALREELYRSYITRASNGESNNEPVIEKILTLKQEKARLLGCPNHAEVSMASKACL